MSRSICLRLLQFLKRPAVSLRYSTSLRVRGGCKVLRAVAFQHFSERHAHVSFHLSAHMAVSETYRGVVAIQHLAACTLWL